MPVGQLSLRAATGHHVRSPLQVLSTPCYRAAALGERSDAQNDSRDPGRFERAALIRREAKSNRRGLASSRGQGSGSIPPSLPVVTVTLMAVVAMIHPGRTALLIIPEETVGIERVAGSVVLAVRGRIILRAVPGILDDGLRSRWTCERRCQQRSAKYHCTKDCKFCHERPRKVGFSGRTPRLRACSPTCSPVPSRPVKSACFCPMVRASLGCRKRRTRCG